MAFVIFPVFLLSSLITSISFFYSSSFSLCLNFFILLFVIPYYFFLPHSASVCVYFISFHLCNVFSSSFSSSSIFPLLSMCLSLLIFSSFLVSLSICVNLSKVFDFLIYAYSSLSSYVFIFFFFLFSKKENEAKFSFDNFFFFFLFLPSVLFQVLAHPVEAILHALA